MAHRRHVARRSRAARPGLIESVIDGASDIVGSVAKQVAPEVVGALDVDAVVQEIDFDALIERIDLNAALERVDVDKLVARLDINLLLEHVDIEALVQRTPMGSLIAQSSAGVAGKVLDVARSQGVGLDGFVHRWVDRVFRRRARPARFGPPLLVDATGPAAS